MKNTNLIGQKFGKITVLSRNKKSRAGYSWLCQCECGNKKNIATSILINNQVKSCGCMKKKPDLIGQEFGSGIVIAESSREENNKTYGKWWKLKCKCGKEYCAETWCLKRGDTKSCGCLYSPDLTGKRFGRGTVIELAGFFHSRKYWLLRCDCGNKYKVTTNHLNEGTINSCGCIAHPNEWGDIPSQLWSEIKRNAQNRKKEFLIDREYAWKIFIKQNGKCALSGIDIVFAPTNQTHKLNRCSTASLDRIDSSKGYIEGNIQWLHKDVNTMKWDHTSKYFIDLCITIANHNKS